MQAALRGGGPAANMPVHRGRSPLLAPPLAGEDRAVRTSGATCLCVLGAWLLTLLAGCGPLRYVSNVTGDASSAVDEARQAKAETLAPYWWTRAVEYLARARHEAAEADWQAANRFGRLAQAAAETAIQEAAAAAKDPSKRPLTEPAVAPAKEEAAPAKDEAAPAKAAPAKESSLAPARSLPLVSAR